MNSFRIILLLALVLGGVGSVASAQNLMARTSDFGIVGGLWLGGDIELSYPSITLKKDAGFMARIFYDSYVVEKLAVGVYGNYASSSVSFGGISASGSAFEFGGAIKARFPIAEGAAVVKPGLNIGYRMLSIDYPGAKDGKGMGVNLSVEFQFASKGLIPFVETGFYSQPVGGNKDTDITWAPIIYIAGGVVF
jgi:hypothetical protein